MIINNIHTFRIDREIRQNQLAEMVGCARQEVSMWENGQKMPRMQTVRKIAHALDCTVEELYPHLAPKDTEQPRQTLQGASTMVILKGAHAPTKPSACQFNLLGWCTANHQKAGDMACRHNTTLCPIIEVSVKQMADLLEMKRDGVKTIIDEATVYPEVIL